VVALLALTFLTLNSVRGANIAEIQNRLQQAQATEAAAKAAYREALQKSEEERAKRAPIAKMKEEIIALRKKIDSTHSPEEADPLRTRINALQADIAAKEKELSPGAIAARRAVTDAQWALSQAVGNRRQAEQELTKARADPSAFAKPLPSAPKEEAEKSPATETKAPLPEPPPESPAPGAADKVIVPDMSVFEGIPQMQAVVSHAGLVGKFAAVKPDKKDQEFKYAGQFPRAGSEAKKGDILVVSFYQKFEDATAETSPSPTDIGKVPNVVGMTLEDAQAALSAAGLSVAGIDDSAKTETPEYVNKIFEQSPPAHAAIPNSKSVSVRRYGGLAAKGPSAPPTQTDELERMIPGSESDLEGEYTGTFDGAPMTASIRRLPNGKWIFGMSVPSTYSGLNSPPEGASVQGGVLSWDTTVSYHHNKVSMKVSGGVLVGSHWYQKVLPNLPAEQPITKSFRGTKTK